MTILHRQHRHALYLRVVLRRHVPVDGRIVSDRQRDVASRHGGGKRPAGFDPAVVLRPQPGGPDPDAAGRRHRLLRDSVHHEHPLVFPYAFADRLLDLDRVLFAHRGPSHPAGADPQRAQGGLHRRFPGDGHSGFHGPGEPVADGPRPRRGAAASSGGPLRSGRDGLVPDDLCPGPAAIDSGPAESDALQQLDHRAFPHRRAGIQRLHRLGRSVACSAAVDCGVGSIPASSSLPSSGSSPSAWSAFLPF